MEIIFSDNSSKDIVEYEAMNQASNIRSIHGSTESINTILRYGASEMRKNLEKERVGSKRFDWDALTYKDEYGNLINLVCDSIESVQKWQKEMIAENIIEKLLENVYKYYKREFEEKVEDAKDYYEKYGNFDNLEA